MPAGEVCCNVSTIPADEDGVIDIPVSDTAALADLVAAERPSALRLAYLLVGSREVAEDIVQTAFLALHRRWGEVDRPAAYLRRVIVNQANDHHRRRHRAAPATPPELVLGIPDIDTTWAEILKLPPVQRDVVVLRFYEDLPLSEIASMLDRPPSTVRSDLRRALDRLRKVLA